MELLHFDTESRKAVLKVTRQELLDLDAELLGQGSKNGGLVTRIVRGAAATLEIYVAEDWR